MTAHAPLYDPVRWWAGFDPDRIALVDREQGRRYSYGELNELGEGAARWLQQQQVVAGDRVAVLAPNCVETLVLFLATLRTRAALVPLNWRLAPAELQAVLDHARPAIALRHASLAPPPGSQQWHLLDEQASAGVTAGGAGRAEVVVAPQRSGDERSDARSRAAGLAGDGGDPALILYTSGSTGRPKGVILPQRQILYNAVATCTAWQLGPDDVAPVSTPLFHTGGWNVFATPLWLCGGTVVLDRFDPEGFLGMLAEERCTVALTVPTQLVMLLAAADWGRPLPALRRFFSGGAPCPPAVARAVRAAGYVLREGYGLTECGPNCFAISDAESLRVQGAVGRPMPFLDARLCNDAGEDVPGSEVGELWLRGPQLFAGYFDDPARTQEVITSDGWLRTGDLARRDSAGLFSICGRRKEMYITGGENVFPGEVEAALMSCAGVAEVAVVGVADPHWGEVGHAFIVPAADSLDEGAVTLHARTCLAGYKVPRRVTLLPALPRLGSGKIDRRALLQLTMLEDA
jgi:fatty-acyl-CoA synthase